MNTGFPQYPRAQPQKNPKQPKEAQIIKPVADQSGLKGELQYNIKVALEKDKKIKPVKVFENYTPPIKNKYTKSKNKK